MQYTRQRGETIVIAVTDSGAEPGDESTVTAGIKRVVTDIYPAQPMPNTDPQKTFTITFRPATGNDDPVQVGKGWDFELSAAECATLTPGLYQFDFSITAAPGERFISDPAYITILEPASL